MDYNLIATATFGLEALVAKELKKLGYENLKTFDGKVEFSGDEMDIAIANVHLRCADRVLIKMGEFKAESFEELFQGIKSIKWEDIIPINGIIHVNGKSIKSKLHSVPDNQSIAKKAIVEAMKRKYRIDTFPEDGPLYKIEVALLKDIVTMTIDTSGNGLHRRGYRENSGAAPLKETLAAAMVMLTEWNGDIPLIDPFCGSGTILIEAALIARNMAPGMNRNFVSETWSDDFEEEFKSIKDSAKKAVNSKKLQIFGYDKDSWVVNTAKQNAKKAGVFENIYFKVRDVNDFYSDFERAAIISNPPYGERLEDLNEVGKLMSVFGEIRKSRMKWDFSIFTAFKELEKKFGEKSDKNRKLYNGRLLCYLYQYKKKDVQK